MNEITRRAAALAANPAAVQFAQRMNEIARSPAGQELAKFAGSPAAREIVANVRQLHNGPAIQRIAKAASQLTKTWPAPAGSKEQ